MKRDAREAEEAIRSLDREAVVSDLERMKVRVRFWEGPWTLLLIGVDLAGTLVMLWLAIFKASDLFWRVTLAIPALLFTYNVVWMLRKRRYWRRMKGTIALVEEAAAGG